MKAVRVLAIVWAVVALGPDSSAAQAPATIVGVVSDAASQPLEGVLVFVDDGVSSVLTDATGAFRLEGIEAGAHVLAYRRQGFAPRSFNVAVSTGDLREIGTVVLLAGPEPTATLHGVVRDDAAGLPLAGATIELNGGVVAVTDSSGAFLVSGIPVRWGSNDVRIVHRAVTETAEAGAIWISSPDETIEMSVELDVVPVALPGVDVAAEPARSTQLVARGFYERMEESSNAVFMTSEDIADRDVDNWDELLRGVRFARTRAAGTFGAAQSGVCGSAMRDAFGDPVVMAAEPRAFLNGALIGYLPQLVDSVDPAVILGIEIYRGVANLPMEFNVEGAECGVVAVWTGTP